MKNRKVSKNIPAFRFFSIKYIFFHFRFYHSILDTADKLDYTYLNGSDAENNSVQSALADTSLAIARALFRMLFKEKQPPQDVKAEPQKVSHQVELKLSSSLKKIPYFISNVEVNIF